MQHGRDTLNQDWFEMKAVRRRNLSAAVWIPLRAIHEIERVGRISFLGFRSEFYGVGTVAIPIDKVQQASGLDWSDVGISHNHFGCVEKNRYIQADVFEHHNSDVSGIYLVLDQRGYGESDSVWHLHQDLVITLGLHREGDVWTRPREGYVEVAKLHRTPDGVPCLLEMRASHLRDYLCARGMSLYVSSYRDRVEIVKDASYINWSDNPGVEIDDGSQWEGRVTKIHEGGMPFGGKTLVVHVERTDVDEEEDVPSFEGPPTDDRVISESRSSGSRGDVVYRVEGELWRTDWIDPAANSPIVRSDDVPSTVFFVTDAVGTRENSVTLKEGGRWLWFRPEVMCALAHRRGGSLGWYTKDTGSVGCSPESNVHFGVNSVGLINAYAKDIALLDDWEQQIWGGYNIAPDGGVSEELLAAQAKGRPADTKAPEKFLETTLVLLNDLAKKHLGELLVKEHEHVPGILSRVHRFRSTSREGLLALAKDLTRLTADRIDVRVLQRVVSPPKGVKWGTLKSLEGLLATLISAEDVQRIMRPLFGTYELRLADAHLPKGTYEEALKLVEVDSGKPFVVQGYCLVHAVVRSLSSICHVFERWE